jgi:hypothetical protein
LSFSVEEAEVRTFNKESVDGTVGTEGNSVKKEWVISRDGP